MNVNKLRSDLPLLPAQCACGHPGKSRRPEYYLCTACYYGRFASANRRKAKKLRARADKLDREALVHDEQRAKFITRHPEAGSP